MGKTLDNFEVFISDMVIQEASKGDKSNASRRLEIVEKYQVLEIDDEAKELARTLIDAMAISDKCPEDALHISVSAVNGIDIIVTWNFKHINNPFTRKMIRKITEDSGYACPEICSPDEFLGGKI